MQGRNVVVEMHWDTAAGYSQCQTRVCTFMVFSGVQVLRSQKRTVVSPDPVASCLPSGLKLVDSTASACPVAHNDTISARLHASLQLQQSLRSMLTMRRRPHDATRGARSQERLAWHGGCAS
jgi:hypothetical protein